ncbi:hypothetical protein ACJX0J_008305, partial [Zea mays]
LTRSGGDWRLYATSRTVEVTVLVRIGYDRTGPTLIDGFSLITVHDKDLHFAGRLGLASKRKSGLTLVSNSNLLIASSHEEVAYPYCTIVHVRACISPADAGSHQ